MPVLTAADEAILLSFERDQLERDTPEAHAAFQKVLSVLVKQRLLNVTEMYASIGKQMGIGTVDHFQESYRSFTGKRKEAVLDYIQSNDVLAPVLHKVGERLNARLFSELTTFLGIESGTVSNAAKYLAGTYQTWRHSVSAPGWYIKGFLQIEQRDKILFARSHYRSVPRGNESEHIKPRYEDLKGYMLRQPGGRCFLFLSDRAHRQVRICIFSGSAPVTQEYDDSKGGEPHMSRVVFSLSGMELGTDEGKTLVSPIYVERVSDETYPLNSEPNRRLRESLNTYREDDVPGKIRANLRQPLTLF